MSVNVFTIGFSQTSASSFFSSIGRENIVNLIDVRLNNISQLSGFAKKNDLRYFLNEICKVQYQHVLEFAPTKDILDQYKSKKISWNEYELRYLDLLTKRKVDSNYDPSFFHQGCLLCSEKHPHQCHRRLLIEYFQKSWDTTLNIKHLV